MKRQPKIKRGLPRTYASAMKRLTKTEELLRDSQQREQDLRQELKDDVLGGNEEAMVSITSRKLYNYELWSEHDVPSYNGPKYATVPSYTRVVEANSHGVIYEDVRSSTAFAPWVADEANKFMSIGNEQYVMIPANGTIVTNEERGAFWMVRGTTSPVHFAKALPRSRSQRDGLLTTSAAAEVSKIAASAMSAVDFSAGVTKACKDFDWKVANSDKPATREIEHRDMNWLVAIVPADADLTGSDERGVHYRTQGDRNCYAPFQRKAEEAEPPKVECFGVDMGKPGGDYTSLARFTPGIDGKLVMTGSITVPHGYEIADITVDGVRFDKPGDAFGKASVFLKWEPAGEAKANLDAFEKGLKEEAGPTPMNVVRHGDVWMSRATKDGLIEVKGRLPDTEAALASLAPAFGFAANWFYANRINNAKNAEMKKKVDAHLAEADALRDKCKANLGSMGLDGCGRVLGAEPVPAAETGDMKSFARQRFDKAHGLLDAELAWLIRMVDHADPFGGESGSAVDHLRTAASMLRVLRDLALDASEVL